MYIHIFPSSNLYTLTIIQDARWDLFFGVLFFFFSPPTLSVWAGWDRTVSGQHQSYQFCRLLSLNVQIVNCTKYYCNNKKCLKKKMTFNSVMNFSENGRTFHDCLGCCHPFQYYMSSIFVFIICACVVDPH